MVSACNALLNVIQQQRLKEKYVIAVSLIMSTKKPHSTLSMHRLVSRSNEAGFFVLFFYIYKISLLNIVPKTVRRARMNATHPRCVYFDHDMLKAMLCL